MKDSIRRLATAINNYVRFEGRDKTHFECLRCGRIEFTDLGLTEVNASGCLQCRRDAKAES